MATHPLSSQTSSTDRIAGYSSGVAVKPPVRVVTTANITLSGEQTINGVAVVDGDRVLVKDQTAAAENGIYECSPSAWTRTPDFDGTRDVVKGTLVVSNNDTSIYYRVVTANPITVGSSSLVFEVVSGAVTQSSIGAALYPVLGIEGSTVVNGHMPYGNVLRYGNNTTPGTTDMRDAVNAAKVTGRVHFSGAPGDIYRINSNVTFASAVRVSADPGVLIRPGLPNSGGKMLAFETDDVLVENLLIDGSGVTGTLTGNTYALFGGDGTTKYYRHRYRNIHIKDCERSDGLTTTSNLLVTHALYVDNVDNVGINDYHVDGVSGAGFFARDIIGLRFEGFTIKDAQWYNINLDSGCDNYVIRDGLFNCTLATGVYWGGAINLQSQVGETRNTNGLIENFKCTGYYSYGTPVRIQSCTNLTVRDFVIEDWQAGSWSASNALSGVRVATRGISTASQNGPCHNIRIYNYEIEAPTNTEEHKGIYVSNEWQTARVPATGIYVGAGRILSTDTADYFTEGVIFHGGAGGIETIRVEDVVVTTVAQTTPVVGGAVGFTGNSADGACKDIVIGGLDLADLGTPAGSHQIGIHIGGYADRVYQSAPSRIDNYYYGVRTAANSGPTMVGIDDQEFSGCTTNVSLAVNLSRFSAPLFGNAAWDPGSIPDGDSETKAVTVTGAALGDFAEASFSLDLLDLGISAYVVSANTVEVVLQNNTGGAVDAGSGTVYVRVKRRGSSG